MNNSSKTISANEISKFVYCPYQWYYERFYGQSHIRRLYKERNEKLGLDDTTLSNFREGLNYHAAYRANKQSSHSYRKALYVVAAICGVAFAIWFYFFV